jgi:hypothetical protein
MGSKQHVSGGGAATALTISGNGSGAVSELSQLALWMAASLGGMVSAALTARTPFFKSILRRLGVSGAAAKSKALQPSREQSLPMLAEAIVGNSKSAIASVFGPPRSAVVMHASTVPGATFWHADTWYYPMPKNAPLAMVIEFNGDDASRVEFLRAPAV